MPDDTSFALFTPHLVSHFSDCNNELPFICMYLNTAQTQLKYIFLSYNDVIPADDYYRPQTTFGAR